MDQAVAAMVQAHPEYSPLFTQEWARRMRSNAVIDAYVDVYVRVYEKYFDADDVAELSQSLRDVAASKASSLSDRFKNKLGTGAIKMQSEIVGGCTQVGVEWGGETGQQIAQEHPEWVGPAKPGVKDNQPPR